MIAVALSFRAIAQMLLDAGADPTANKAGRTALQMTERAEMIAMLQTSTATLPGL